MRTVVVRNAKELKGFALRNRAQVASIRKSMHGKRNNRKQQEILRLDRELQVIVKAYVAACVRTRRSK